MMRILLSNDDGVYAPGIKAMYEELKKIGDVWVVAPLQEKSTTGHSLTIHKPLRLHEVETDFYGVSGSPADCIYLGIRQVMKKMPDLVVSGINRGANLGQDVYYSGTVSAAREASILGIPSLAISLAVQYKNSRLSSGLNYKAAAKTAIQVLKNLKGVSVPKYTLLNLNVPDIAFSKIKGIKLAKQGFRIYDGTILRRTDHRGKDYFWIGGEYQGFLPDKESDCFAVDSGYAALTPIQLDSTNHECLSLWEKKGTQLFSQAKKR